MRLDKYLKVSRIIKRRTLAKEVTDQGRVQLNGQTAKASTTIKVGDILTIKFGQKVITVKITEVKENSRKEEAKEMFEVIGEEKIEG